MNIRPAPTTPASRQVWPAPRRPQLPLLLEAPRLAEPQRELAQRAPQPVVLLAEPRHRRAASLARNGVHYDRPRRMVSRE